MELDEVAGRLDRLGTQVTSTGTGLAGADPGPRGFGGDGPGALPALGRALHRQWLAAQSARQQEANGHGAQLIDLAVALRRAADGYRDAEHGAHQRHQDGA